MSPPSGRSQLWIERQIAQAGHVDLGGKQRSAEAAARHVPDGQPECAVGSAVGDTVTLGRNAGAQRVLAA